MTIQSSRAGVAPASGRRMTACRELCRAHGGALVAIAQLILDDAQDVGEVVAEAIAAECRTDITVNVGSSHTRQRLARSVFDRSRGRLVMRERFGEPAGVRSDPRSGELPSVLGRLSAEVRATVALTMFGLHGLTEAAAVLSISPETVLRQLRVALAAAHEATGTVATPGWDVTGRSTGDSGRRGSGLSAARQRFASENGDAPAELAASASAAVWVPVQRTRAEADRAAV